jgi:hypothetical protein
MYEMLMMLKPGEAFSVESMEALVRAVCHNDEVGVFRRDDTITVKDDDAQIIISFSDGDWVAEEARELADHFGVPSAGCIERYEMSGNDPEMVLFNVFLLINERLDSTGLFILFDCFSGDLFGKA